MHLFEWTLWLLVAAVVLTALARRFHAPYPSMLALLGALLVLLPGTPHVALEPELALALFVAPVLLDAAFDSSTRDLRHNWRPIAGLVFVAVGVTTLTVALVTRWFVPELPWAAAIALGAIVAPPDAAAATAVLREAKPPRRIVQILEGESLFNDVTALLIYRFAVVAAMGGTFSVTTAAPTLVLVLTGSLVMGWVLARLASWIMGRVEDVPSAVILQFASTFGVWLLAERLGLSAILTVVTYAFAAARYSRSITAARVRVPSYAFWETTVFVLNALAFVLIGLQLGPILDRLDSAELLTYSKVALAVLGVVILTRLLWVLTYTAAVRRVSPRMAAQSSVTSLKGAVVVSWCGMRGIVTLAAALALPDGDNPFPGRDLILLAAFTVVLGTLVLQGFTLRPLLRWFDVGGEDHVQPEVALARRAVLKAALSSIDGDTSSAAQALRAEYCELWPDDEAPTAERGTPGLPQLRERAVTSARRALVELLQDGTIGNDAYQRVEEELDRAELYAQSAHAAAASQSTARRIEQGS